MRKSWYDTAQVCLNGHLINSRFQSIPNDNRARCPKCGDATITKCPQCGKTIKGYKHIENLVYPDDTVVPEYCEQCGKPMPWTEKRQAVERLEQTLNSVDKEMKQRKVKRIFISVYKWCRSLFVEVSSEAIKKTIEQKL